MKYCEVTFHNWTYHYYHFFFHNLWETESSLPGIELLKIELSSSYRMSLSLIEKIKFIRVLAQPIFFCNLLYPTGGRSYSTAIVVAQKYLYHSAKLHCVQLILRLVPWMNLWTAKLNNQIGFTYKRPIEDFLEWMQLSRRLLQVKLVTSWAVHNPLRNTFLVRVRWSIIKLWRSSSENVNQKLRRSVWPQSWRRFEVRIRPMPKMTKRNLKIDDMEY